MKKFALTFCLIVASICMVQAEDKDPILMTIGGDTITKSEFEYIYQKNNSEVTEDKKSLSEYLILFEDFKLKVIEAENRGMDTLPQFLQELKGYRAQLAKPYLIDKDAEENLYHLAYSHLLEDVDVSHILIQLPKKSTPEDTLKAYHKIQLAYNSLLKGQDFSQVADQYSEDPSVSRNHGHLGYFTGLMTMWPFEKTMYELKVGETSKPVRTSYGYHIIHVNARRPAVGEVRTSHIMKLSNERMTPEEQLAAKTEIYSLYDSLRHGADFATLAHRYSDDKGTATKGGDLNWFGVSRMVPAFEEVAFSTPIDSISQPFPTEFGWHIMKVTGRRPVAPFEDKKQVIQQAMRYDERANVGQDAFVNNLKEKNNFVWNDGVYERFYQQLTFTPQDSLLLNNESLMNEVLCTWSSEDLTLESLLYYCLGNEKMDLNTLKKSFTKTQLLEYADSRLESQHKDFANLVREYHDGILLFNISQEEVWNKASIDTKGLNRYFKSHKKKYAWDTPHYKGYIIRAKNQEAGDAALKLIKTAPKDSMMSWISRRINNDSVKYVTIEHALWKEGENSVIDDLVFHKEGKQAETSEAYPIIMVHGKVLKKYPQNYNDVRGAVTSDYQVKLDEDWIKKLRKKYDIVVHEDVLNTIQELK